MIKRIIREMAEAAGLPVSDIVGPCKDRKVLKVRQAVRRRLWEETNLNLLAIDHCFRCISKGLVAKI